MGQDFYLILENWISFIGYLSTDYFEQDAVSEKLWFRSHKYEAYIKGAVSLRSTGHGIGVLILD